MGRDWSRHSHGKLTCKQNGTSVFISYLCAFSAASRSWSRGHTIRSIHSLFRRRRAAKAKRRDPSACASYARNHRRLPFVVLELLAPHLLYQCFGPSWVCHKRSCSGHTVLWVFDWFRVPRVARLFRRDGRWWLLAR